MPPSPNPQRSPVIPSLTGVRGIAAVWVVIYHVQNYADALGLASLAHRPILRDGWMGVDLFFILSGFVLAHTHAAEFGTVEPMPVLRFYRARLLRIYPVTTASLLLILAITLFDPGFTAWYRASIDPSKFSVIGFFRTLLLATRWGPACDGDWNQPVWSVSVEMIGYGAFPWIACRMRSLRSPSLAVGIALASLGAYIGLTLLCRDGEFNEIGPFAIVRMSGGFVAGVALWRAWSLLEATERRWPCRTAALAAAAIVASCATDIAKPLVTLALAALIFALAFRQGRWDRLLSSPIPMGLGRISFPLYLVHLMALMLTVRVVLVWKLTGASAYVALVVYAAVCLGLAWLLHEIVERPAQRWSRRWAARSISARADRGGAVPVLTPPPRPRAA